MFLWGEVPLRSAHYHPEVLCISFQLTMQADMGDQLYVFNLVHKADYKQKNEFRIFKLKLMFNLKKLYTLFFLVTLANKKLPTNRYKRKAQHIKNSVLFNFIHDLTVLLYSGGILINAQDVELLHRSLHIYAFSTFFRKAQ